MQRLSVYDNLRYDKRRNAFILGDQSLRGIHNSIADCFYPSYSFERANIGPPTGAVASSSSSSRSKSPRTKRKPTFRGKTQAKRHEEAMNLGSRVDQQLAKITELLKSYPGLEIAHFLSPPRKLATQLRTNETARHRITNLRRSLCAHTKRIIVALRDLRLVPVESQLVVCNEALRMGTAVDLVCRHQGSRRITILEIKCGYDAYYFSHTAHKMSEPFNNINDSPHNQHQIQLGLTVAMFCRVYGMKLKDIDAWVVRSHSRGVSGYPLSSWVRENLGRAQVSLFKHMKEVERQKKLEA
jgi:hypothetical protein